MINKKQQGFTLFEVLISMFIAGVAVLGLVMLELNILRSSQSSYNYTVATIEANSLVDQTWGILCELESADAAGVVALYNNDLFLDWWFGLATTSHSALFSGVTAPTNASFTLDSTITVSWQDRNFATDPENDKVVLNATYPDFSGGCL